jgi:DNA helicase II / ATP-dependent DNA helicase PcrA
MKFFQDWEEYKSSLNKVDFSDMIELVIKHEIELDTPVLIIDEFQDLTAQMFKLFNFWQVWCEYVLVAGDPNQSIYGYDGGSPKYYYDFYADEILLRKTHRLPIQIKNYCNILLENEGMSPTPMLYAKNGLGEVIKALRWNEEYPTHDSELHLVRCNYQIPAIANRLIAEGKVFMVHSRRNWFYGWTKEEVDLANGILSIRNMKPVTEEHVKAIVKYFSSEVLEITEYGKTEKEQKVAYLDTILIDYPKEGITYFTQLQTGNGLLNSKVLDSIYSDSPTYDIIHGGEILLSKIKGILNRTELIKWNEVKNRRIMTIHSAKGLEADAVFLHTGITKAIYNSMCNGEGVEAEVRIWNVGISRAREVLYIIKDKGRNFNLPDFNSVPAEDYIFESIEEAEKIVKRARVSSDW